MTTTSAEIEPKSIWRRAGRRFARVRDWPSNGNNPYSPFFCASLLLGVALILEVAH